MHGLGSSTKRRWSWKQPLTPDMTLFDHIVDVLEDGLGKHRVFPNRDERFINIKSVSGTSVHSLSFRRVA